MVITLVCSTAYPDIRIKFSLAGAEPLETVFDLFRGYTEKLYMIRYLYGSQIILLLRIHLSELWLLEGSFLLRSVESSEIKDQRRPQ